MLRRIWALLHKEFIQTLRDRRTLLIQIGLPIVQLFIFGYAIRMNVEHVPTAVADQSLDSASRAYVQSMVVSGYFDVIAYLPSQEEVIRAIDEGRAQAGIVIPPGFQASVTRGEAQALLLVDGSDVFTSQTAYRSITAIAGEHSTGLMIAQLQRAGQLRGEQRILPIDTRVRILYN
ncbi:MAG TPA: ABC transporter permease, partial [Anaerolineae bacterium]|nr:ABC transporter permease [Anaerolineae bacterium]